MTVTKIFYFLTLLVASIALAEGNVQIGNPRIRSAFQEKSLRSRLGIVKGVRSCGGNGELLEWRFETCRESDTPCKAPADGTWKRAEVDFIPSKDIASLGLRLNVKSEDGLINKEVNFKGPIITGKDIIVKRGEAYTIANAGGVTEELKGKRATFQYILYDKENNQVEICAESEFQYV